MTVKLTASQKIELDERRAKDERERQKKRERIQSTVAAAEEARNEFTMEGHQKTVDAALLAIELTGDLHADITDTKHSVRNVASSTEAVHGEVKLLSGNVKKLTEAVSNNGHTKGVVRIPLKDREPLELPSWLVVTLTLIVVGLIGWLVSSGYVGEIAKAYNEVQAVRKGIAPLPTPTTGTTDVQPTER